MQLEGTFRLKLLSAALDSLGHYEDAQNGEAGSARFVKQLANLSDLLQ